MKIRWAIIGAGGIAVNRMIPAMLRCEGCEVTAVMRTDRTKLAAVQRQFDIPHAFDNVDDLMHGPAYDAVYIASPVYAHADQAIRCAEAGKPVLVEKPVGMNAREVAAIRLACKAGGTFFDAALMMRYHGLHEKMRELIAQGAIGTPVSVRMDFSFRYPEWEGAWRQRQHLGGGGVLMDLGPHCLDLIQYVTSRSISKIRGALINTQTFGYEVEDSASVLMEMDGGVHALLSTHFNVPEAASGRRFEVFGTKGSLVATGTLGQTETGSLLRKSGEGAVEEIGLPRRDESFAQYGLYIRELESFMAKMQDRPLWDAVMDEQTVLQELIDAIYKKGREA